MNEFKENLPLNSVQLNIVTFVDVQKAIAQQTLKNAVYMMDNSLHSKYQGTPSLQTVCKQGQVLNWIIYPMNADRRTDGSWPPFAKISNIVFLKNNKDDVSSISICNNLKVYGSVDKIRSFYTPVYYYWAGSIPSSLPEGVYPYRLILELDDENNGRPLYLNLDGPELYVNKVEKEDVES